MGSQANATTNAVEVPAGDVSISADLTVPGGASAMVIFAHGSGSSRHSPRNKFVAEQLNSRSLATLLLDLLTEQEDVVDQRTREFRFDIPRLAERLGYAIEYVGSREDLRGLPVGLFGSSTGAAAALIAAAERPDDVHAVVSRGGRCDMAEDSLEQARCPTLMIVGGRDDVVIDLNRKAIERMDCEKRLEIVEGATHLFEEPGALENVADLAGDWFADKLK